MTRSNTAAPPAPSTEPKTAGEVAREKADSDVEVLRLADRARRLTAELAAARAELDRAKAGVEPATEAVRKAMAEDGDVAAAEMSRDSLGTRIKALEVKIADLTVAEQEVSLSHDVARRAAIDRACAAMLPAARAAYEQATQEHADLRRRHAEELEAATARRQAATAEFASLGGRRSSRAAGFEIHTSGGALPETLTIDVAPEDADDPVGELLARLRRTVIRVRRYA